MKLIEGLLGLNGGWQLAFALELSARMALLVGAAWLLSSVGSNRTPTAQRTIWGTVLGGAVAAAVVSVWGVGFDIPFRIPYALAHVDNVPHLSGLRAEVASLVLPEFVNGAGSARSPGVWAWLFLIWLVGFICVGLRLGVGLHRLRRVRVEAEYEEPGMRTALLEQVARELSIARPVTLAWSDRLSVPGTFGVRKPVLILPSEARDWSPVILRAVFLHELAHVQRLDWAFQIAGRVACAIYWFHPAVWWACRLHARAVEAVADGTAADRFGSRVGYSGQLLAAARLLTARPARLPALTMNLSAGDDLERRVREVLREGAAPPSDTRRLAIGMVAIALASAFFAPVLGGCF